MAFYYPQAVMTLNIRWEDFNSPNDEVLTKNYRMTVIAKSVSVNINDYTQADTFAAEIDYKNFPFDPRCIRALGATVHMEDKGKVFRSDNRLNMITPTEENTMFVGFADEESIDFDTETRIVKFEGRDYTSLFIDTPYDGKAVDMSRPLEDIFTEILGRLPSTEKITLDNRTGGVLPNIGKFSPDFSPLGQSRSGKKKESFWDVIQDLTQRAGLISYIELDKLVISNPRTIYSDTSNYQFIYGRNLKSLSFKRKLGRQKGINILVRSLNVEKKELLEAKIPLEANQEWATALNIPLEVQKIDKIDSKGQVTKEDAPYLTFSVPNIANKEQLVKIGQSIFEEVGRQQIEGTMVTRDMCQLQDGTRFDLRQIRNGTPIKIDIDQGDMEGLRRIKTPSAREKFLRDRCYPPDVARAFARTLGKYSTRFYTKSAEYTINKDSGFELRVDFLNYIELENKGLI